MCRQAHMPAEALKSPRVRPTGHSRHALKSPGTRGDFDANVLLDKSDAH